MSPKDLANAYQAFFFKSEAGKQFMEWLAGIEDSHISRAQKDRDVNELAVSAGNKEVFEHITTVIAQVAHPSE